jgi:ferric-dicitrate binding protein FerR (iron transport regulator)
LQHNLQHIDELIGKYLAGEATPEEIAFVERWEREDKANEQYVNQFRTIFTKSAAIREWQEFDTDAAWSKLKSQLQKPKGKVIPIEKPSSSFSWLKIAASIIIIMGVGFSLYKLYTRPALKPIEVVANKQTVSDTLPDGSDVFLNKETKLAYSYDRKKKTHLVKLKGEAYFNINHEDDKKFLVDAGGVFIRDIGTSFNVTAYPESNTIEVVVEEGEIQFFTEADSGISLKAGGKGVYNKKTKSFTIEQPENNVLAYKTKFFSFSEKNLGEAVETLNSVYDKKIVISEKLRSCRLTVSFNDEDIHEIAQVIAETLNLTVKETATEILLEGEGCENQ